MDKGFFEEIDKVQVTKDRYKLLEDIGKIRSSTDMLYFDVNWIEKHIFRSYAFLYCPNCFKNDIKINDDTFALYCKCGWKGNAIDLLSEEEAKNSKKSDLIDKILR